MDSGKGTYGIYKLRFTNFKISGAYFSDYWSENDTFDDAESKHKAKLSVIIADMLSAIYGLPLNDWGSKMRKREYNKF